MHMRLWDISICTSMYIHVKRTHVSLNVCTVFSFITNGFIHRSSYKWEIDWQWCRYFLFSRGPCASVVMFLEDSCYQSALCFSNFAEHWFKCGSWQSQWSITKPQVHKPSNWGDQSFHFLHFPHLLCARLIPTKRYTGYSSVYIENQHYVGLRNISVKLRITATVYSRAKTHIHTHGCNK